MMEKQMLEWGYNFQLAFASLAGAFALLLGIIKRPPSWWSVGSVILVEALLLVQLVVSIVLVVQGQQAKGDTVEFLGYIITALVVPPAAIAWAVLERTRWSTLVLGVAGFTVAVMLVRMWQIWTGIRFSI
jgi:glucose-6-phosphate-specific signal transduction histidine kinase